MPSRTAAPASSGVSAATPTQLGSLEHSLPSAGDLLSAAMGAPTSEVRQRGRQRHAAEAALPSMADSPCKKLTS